MNSNWRAIGIVYWVGSFLLLLVPIQRFPELHLLVRLLIQKKCSCEEP